LFLRQQKKLGSAADGFTLLNLAFSEPASQNSTGQGHPQTTFLMDDPVAFLCVFPVQKIA
jgi:hypothetical protein